MDGLHVRSIAVGHGDATLLDWRPEGANRFALLIDGGPRGAGKAIREELTRQSIAKIDLLVLTHVDADHVDGLLELVDDVPIGTYWGPCVRAFERHAWLFRGRVMAAINKARELETKLVAKGTVVLNPTEGFRITLPDERLGIRVLAPAGRLLERLLLDDDVLELFTHYPMPQGWLFEAPPPPPDERPSYRALRDRLQKDTWITPDDVKDVADAKATALDLTAVQTEVTKAADIEPEFFGNNVLNDTSLVVQVDVHLDRQVRRRILLPGDLENWLYLVAQHGGGLDCDVLKAPHHGGRVYVERELDFDGVYQWIRPSVVLVSATGRHKLPRLGFREAAMRWGATLFCPCRRGKEVVFGSPGGAESCYKAFSCSSVKTTTNLEITAGGITADAPACASGPGDKRLPIVRIQQHVIQPSGVLDRLGETEVDRHASWLADVLRKLHDERAASLVARPDDAADLDPISVETLRRRAREDGRHVLAADLEEVLMYASRRARLWFARPTSGRPAVEKAVYMWPDSSQLKSAEVWLRSKRIVLFRIRDLRPPASRAPDAVLDALDIDHFARICGAQHLFPSAVIREAFWPPLSKILREEFVAWTMVRQHANAQTVMFAPKAAGPDLDKWVSAALPSDELVAYADARHTEHSTAYAVLERLAPIVCGTTSSHQRYPRDDLFGDHFDVEYGGTESDESPRRAVLKKHERAKWQPLW